MNNSNKLTKAYRVHEKGATEPMSGHFLLRAVNYTLSTVASFGNYTKKAKDKSKKAKVRRSRLINGFRLPFAFYLFTFAFYLFPVA
ncbi:MAG TPA: hypothetical protein VGN95_07945 [Pyrinomonadaceae bacterium]|jgi:hypothetical protein|nr:hypothetical protein [Pyrinomonadaceae bacterium]